MKGENNMIYKQIEADIKKAMIGGNDPVRDALRFLKSKIQQVSKDSQMDIDNNMTITTIKKLVKQNQDSLSYNPTDAEKIQEEINIWESYLPQQIVVTDELIDDIIKESGVSSIKEMGKVMGLIKKKYGVNIDMGLASSKVKEKLNG